MSSADRMWFRRRLFPLCGLLIVATRTGRSSSTGGTITGWGCTPSPSAERVHVLTECRGTFSTPVNATPLKTTTAG